MQVPVTTTVANLQAPWQFPCSSLEVLPWKLDVAIILSHVDQAMHKLAAGWGAALDALGTNVFVACVP